MLNALPVAQPTIKTLHGIQCTDPYQKNHPLDLITFSILSEGTPKPVRPLSDATVQTTEVDSVNSFLKTSAQQ